MSEYIQTIIISATIVIGVIGNAFVLYILGHKQFIHEPIFRYLFLATVLDLINLWPELFGFYSNFFQIDTYSENCKWSSYIFSIIDSSIPWVMLMSSFERYLQVYYPNRLLFRNKFKYQVLLIFIITCCLIIINLPFYFYVDIVVSSNTTICSFVDYNPYIPFVLDLFFFFYEVLIPLVLMFTCTRLISKKLIQNNLLHVNQSKYDKNKHLVRMLLSMDLFFLICNLPAGIISCLADLLPNDYFDKLVLDLFDESTYIFHACDFLIYYYCNNLFRKFVHSIFSKSQINPVTTHSLNVITNQQTPMPVTVTKLAVVSTYVRGNKI